MRNKNRDKLKEKHKDIQVPHEDILTWRKEIILREKIKQIEKNANTNTKYKNKYKYS